MPDYKVNDETYTEEEANAAASSMGMDLMTWKNSFNAELIAGNQSDPANAANAGSENSQASNQEELGSFGNPSSSASLLNEEDFNDETPEWISQLYKDNPYDTSNEALLGGGFEYNINLLEKEKDKYSMMDTKSSDIDNEIKRLKFEQGNTGERQRTRRSRENRKVKNELAKFDEKITNLYSDETLTIEEKKARELGIIEDKETYLNFGLTKIKRLEHEENVKILENISKTSDNEANSSGFQIYSDNEDEEIELTQQVEDEILNIVSENKRSKQRLIGSLTDDAVSATMGFEQKEQIINTAKMQVLSTASDKAQQDMARLQNELYKAFDSEQDLTQEAVDEFNDKANIIRDNYANLAAQYDFDLAKKAFTNNNFELTTEFREWRDKKIEDGEFLASSGDFIGTIGQGLRDFGTEYLYGLPSMANRLLLYGITELGGDTESAYARLNYVDDLVDSSFLKNNTFGISDVGGSLAGKDFSFTDLSTYNVGTRSTFKTLGNMLPFTLALAAAVKKGDFRKLKDVYKMFGKNKKGLQWGNVGLNIPKLTVGGKVLLKGGRKDLGGIGMNTLRMGQVAYMGTIRDNYNEALDMGLDEGQALAYSNMASFATSVVQGIMPDANFFNTTAGKGLLEVFRGNLSKAANKKAIKEVSKQFVNNLAGEIGEEEMELLLTDLAKVTVGLSNQTGFLDAQTQFETLMGTLILSGSTSAVSSTIGGGYNNVKKQVYSEMRANVTGVMESLKVNKEYSENLYNRAKAAGKTKLMDKAKLDMDAADKALQHGNDIKNAITLGGEFVTDTEIDLYIEKQKLIDAKKMMGDKSTATVEMTRDGMPTTFTGDLKSINERIADIDASIADGDVAKNKKEITDKTNKASEKTAKKLGIDMNSFEDDSDLDAEGSKTADQKIKDKINAINDNLPTRNKGKKDEEKDKEVSIKRVGDNGFVVQYKDGTQEIIINKTKSEKNSETTVAQHEILHSVLNETLMKNPKAAQAMAGALKDQVDNMIAKGYDPSSYLSTKLQAYKNNPADVQAEELLTFFSDGMAQGFIGFEENMFTKLKDVLRQTFQDLGLKGIKLDTGKDVYNFLKDYNKSMASGKGIKGSLLDVAKGGVKGSLVNGLGAQSALERNVNQSFANKTKGYGSEIVNFYTPIIKKLVFGSNKNLYGNKSLVGQVRGMQSKILDIVKNHNESDPVSLTDKIGRLFGPTGTSENTKSSKDLYSTTEGIMGLEESMTEDERMDHMSEMSDSKKTRLGQLVGYEYTNEVNRRLRKFKNIPGFGAVKESILADITYGTTKQGKSGKEVKVQGIVGIVERYSGSIELNRWINGQLDNKIQGIVESYNLGKEVEGFSKKSGKDPSINKGRYTNIIKTNAVPDFAVRKLKQAVIKVVRVLKTSVLKATSKNVTIAPWIREFKKDIGKQNDIVFKELMGGLAKNKFSNYLIKNKKTILENMTTTWLGSAIPGAVQKKVDGKWTYEWQGKKVDFESSAETGRTSGLEMVKRNTNMSDEQFLSYFGNVVNKDGNLSFESLTRGRKESLAKAMAEETGLELIANDTEVFNELSRNQDNINVVSASIDILDIGRDIERGNSKSNKSAENVQAALFDMMDSAILNGGSSDAYLLYKSEQPKDIQAYAEEIGLGTYFDEGKTGFKKPLTEWKDMPLLFGPALEVYKRSITNKNKDVSMEQLAEFSGALIDILPPELVDVLGDDMFSITYSYLDGAKKKADGKPGKYYELSKKRKAKGDKDSDIELTFNPADIKIFNSASGVMKQITTILKKNKTAAEKQTEIEEKFGDIIAKAEIANIEALKYIMNKATELIAKNPSLAPGFMRWLESSTSNVKAQRGLTRLPLIQYVDGPMDANENHIFYEQAKKFAIDRSTKMYDNKSAKFKKENTLDQFIKDRLEKHPPEKHLKFKGEHVAPAANVMLDLAKVALKTAAKIHQMGLLSKPKQLNSLNTFAGLEMDKILSTYNQTLGTELFSAIQDDALGTTSKLGDFRGLTVDTGSYNTFLTSEGIQAIEYIKRQNLSIEFINEVISKTNVDNYINNQNKTDALSIALDPNTDVKGISVFDFDDTLAQTKSNVLYTLPDGTTGKIDATQFAAQSAELETRGAKFDFSEFTKVIDGKKGPLADLALKRQGKFGSGDIFVLTARPQASDVAIQQFLKEVGLDIKIGNITGLADGNAQAKADWIIGKAADGYNDFYFADDAIKNVKAVKDALDVLDVKGKVQQAIVKSNKSLDLDFNNMLEAKTGIDSNKRYSKAKAKMIGRDKGRFRFFLPPSAEDFMGLMYDFIGKGKEGDAQKQWIKDNLLAPYSRGVAKIEQAKQAVQDSYNDLRKKFPDVKKKLGKQIDGLGFTYDQAVRVYLYTKAGHEVQGLAKSDLKDLLSIVNGDERLKLFADSLSLISNQKEGYVSPGEYWLTESIASDLDNITNKVGRKEFIKEFIDNSKIVFSEQNLNKIEAAYGESFRESLEDILYRMENGTNRTFGKNKLVNAWSNWLNNSVGAIMFFNMRSALLQTLSTVNFINWTDNNPLKAATAFANQKQYWKDFSMIFNSSKLKQRRKGLKTDVNEAELANAVAGSQNKAKAAFQYLLKIGFTPTQIADSFAISAGGATMYRNRVKTYLKEGMDQKQAEDKAFEDFSAISEESQQSSDPSLISAQQAGPLGRFILAFQNTPMQYNRLIKKATRDLINGRGDWRSNVSKIAYYGAVQNFIFTAMQKALFSMLFEDEDERCANKKGKALERCQNNKWAVDTGNSMVDTLMRGSGLFGAVAATIKNVIRQFARQEEKGFTADHTYTILEMANLSPPLGSKLRKIYNSIQTYRFEKDVIKGRGLALDSPTWSVIGNLVSGLTNVPLDRLVKKVNNVTAALDERNAIWKRVFFAFGWNTWDLNAAPNETHMEIKAEAKELRKEQGKIKAAETRARKKIEKETMLAEMTNEQRLEYELELAAKRSASAKKGAATRKENKRIKDSIAGVEYAERTRIAIEKFNKRKKQ